MAGSEYGEKNFDTREQQKKHLRENEEKKNAR